MTQAGAIECDSGAAAADAGLRVESVAFAEIPGQSKLFLRYLEDPLSLKRYYPNAVASHTHLDARVSEVLRSYTTDRGLLCDALEESNVRLGASRRTIENISLLRSSDTVAVVTGQQAGLFTGPLYTIYKAISAIKTAEGLRGRGVNAVPVFWTASEDHDLDEVSSVTVLADDGSVATFANRGHSEAEGVPVGLVTLDESIGSTITQLLDAMGRREFSEGAAELLGEAWQPGRTYADAFSSTLLRIFASYGLIVLSPMEAAFKRLASPIYVSAIESSDEIVEALIARSDELEREGFAAQVLVEKDYFPLFWHDDDGVRRALRTTSKGTLRSSGAGREFTRDELITIARDNPERLSPSVVLRSVVQDQILPTICYYGGGAEIAYFAQSGEVYRVLGRPVTPILHRQSFTIVERRHARSLDRYTDGFTDLFGGRDELLPRIVESELDSATARLFAEVEEEINTQLHHLDTVLTPIDQGLAMNLAKRRKKILYHIAAMRAKFYKVRVRRDEVLDRRLNGMFAALLPEGKLQERSLNIAYYLDRYGPSFVDWLYRASDLDDSGHRLVYF